MIVGRARVLVAMCVLAACTRNPANGRLQFGLPADDEEIELGRRADAEVRSSMPIYDEVPTATAIVADTGKKVAAVTERPELPWQFTILDDPAVNAFALPGGFVYVTRG